MNRHFAYLLLAAERGIAEEEALKNGLEEKSKQIVKKDAEVYTKA